jgi:hypothetical protein
MADNISNHSHHHQGISFDRSLDKQPNHSSLLELAKHCWLVLNQSLVISLLFASIPLSHYITTMNQQVERNGVFLTLYYYIVAIVIPKTILVPRQRLTGFKNIQQEKVILDDNKYIK